MASKSDKPRAFSFDATETRIRVKGSIGTTITQQFENGDIGEGTFKFKVVEVAFRTP